MATAILEGGAHFVKVQVHCIFSDFKCSGIPWRGKRARSAQAGLSGIFYAMAAFACPSAWEKAMWILQAVLSVWADYFNIHHDHIAHGIDRYYAMSMTLRMIIIGLTRVQPWMALAAFGPIGCMWFSHAAKADKDYDRWAFWHLMWHITGSCLCTLTMFIIYSCEAGVYNGAMLEAACQSQS